MRFARSVVVGALAAMSAGTMACSPGDATRPSTLPDDAPPGGRFSGLFLLGPDDYDAHTAKMQAGPAVVHLFVDWFGPEQLARANADPTHRVEPRPVESLDLQVLDPAFRPGTTVAISWALPLPLFDVPAAAYPHVPSVRDLLRGRYDAYVRDFARAIAALESPVLLTLFGEFDNNAFYAFGPDGLHAAAPDPEVPPELQVPVASDLTGWYGDPSVPDGPERVRDAFIRVIDIFEAEGVTDIGWFMYGSSSFATPEASDDPTQLTRVVAAYNRPEHYFPGDDYIDYVGKSLHHRGLDDLRTRFEPAYDAWGRVTQKPFFAPEFTIYEGVGSASRAPLIREEFMRYLPRFDRFAGFATVDQDPRTGDATFGLVTIGGNAGEFPDEIDAWREAVVENPAWSVRR
jgi:hypothetical protein